MVTIRGMLHALIHWAFAIAALCPAGCEADVLSTAQSQYGIGGFDVAVLKDAAGSLSVEALERPDQAARFVPLNGPPRLGYEKEVVWLRLRLQRLEDAPQTWFLELSNPFVNDLRLYTRSASGFTVAQAGDLFAFADRALKFRFPVFALAFPDAQMQTFYLRLDSDSSLAGALVVWQPDALRDKAQQEVFYFGAVLGMIFMSCLISSIHGLVSREKKVLLFALLTVNAFFLVAIGLGLFAQFLAPTLPVLADLCVPWSLSFNAVLAGLVFGCALNLHADFPRLGQFIRLASCLALVAPLSRWFNMYAIWGGPMLQAVSLVVVLCTGWLSWVRWRSHAKGAGYFLVAHLVLVVSMSAGRLILMGWLPANAVTQMSWIPGLAIYIFLVHAGIFVDSQALKQERDAAFAESKTTHEVLVSERALREEQIVFFSFVAHELRSPLAAILTGVKNLENELAGVQHAALARTWRIKAYAERMGSLIDRHLTFQRLADADFLPQFARHAPLHIAEECLRHARALFAGRVFLADYAEGLPACISADRELLCMALDNLLVNAAKYSPESSDIALQVFADTALHFRVFDRGPGIRPEQTDRLFCAYKRLQQPDLAGGYGLGLALARRIALAHGGSLEYADRAGGGSIFTLTLPLSAAQAGSAA